MGFQSIRSELSSITAVGNRPRQPVGASSRIRDRDDRDRDREMYDRGGDARGRDRATHGGREVFRGSSGSRDRARGERRFS
jgi:hypothetical protein